MKDYKELYGNLVDGEFPNILAKNASGKNAQDGTPYSKEFIDDIWGWMQDVMNTAGLTPNGNSEAAGSGQLLQGMKAVIQQSINKNNAESSPVLARHSPFLAATDKRKVTIKAGTRVGFGTGQSARSFSAGQDIELDVAGLLDTGTITNGKDYYVFLCPQPGGNNVLPCVSLNKTAPLGLNPADVKLIGGFHTLCADAGTGLTYVEGGETKDHPLNGYVAGDILPYSVWCLNHRPHSEPEGMVYIPSLDFWVDIYLQSGSGKNTKSAYQGALTRSRQYVDHVEDMFCVKKELLDDGEFAAAMLGSNEMTNVQGTSESGATSGGAGGRVDTAGRRMISIYGIEEGCGSLWQWLRTTTAGGMAGALYGQTADTPTYGVITMTPSSYGPYGQAGGKGSYWGLAGALLAGGYWGNGSPCGSRSRDASRSRSSANTNHGGRGRSRSIRLTQ